MALVKVQGIVIKNVNLGEADKIITLFTDRLGKISAVVHGARKPKSRLMSSTQIFSYCEYVLYKGKSLYTINQAELKESFQVILNDLYTITYSSYLIELIDVLTQEGESNIELFKLLLRSLYLLVRDTADKELIVRAFELKSLVISGYMPNLSVCSVCSNDKLSFIRFSNKLGGIICESCSSNDSSSIKVSISSINAMRYLMKTDMEKINTLKVSSIIKNDMKKILKNYIKYYLEKDFKSMNFLDDLKNIDNA